MAEYPTSSATQGFSQTSLSRKNHQKTNFYRCVGYVFDFVCLSRIAPVCFRCVVCNVVWIVALGGKLTKRLVENLGPGRHGDGSGLYLVVDPSGARRWIVRVTVKGQKNRMGAPLRTDFGLGRCRCGYPEPSTRPCA